MRRFTCTNGLRGARAFFAAGLLCAFAAGGVLTGCGGGDGGDGGGLPTNPAPTNPAPAGGRGVLGQASPFTGFVQFLSDGSCHQNGYYLTLELDEDEAGNLTGSVVGRKVSPSNPPPSGDDKYTGPLSASVTGRREGDAVTLTLSGDITGTYSVGMVRGTGFTRISGNVDGQPGCSDSKGSAHEVKVFLVGDEAP